VTHLKPELIDGMFKSSIFDSEESF